MNSKTEYFEDLKTIRKVMEESSRFLSLSGLSGIFAGLSALAGVLFAFLGILNGHLLFSGEFINSISPEEIPLIKMQLIVTAVVVLILAVSASVFFSFRTAAKKGVTIWTPVSRRLLVNLIIPLITGGIFISILFIRGDWMIIIAAMLIFYGLALVNAGKFTYSEVFYLGILQIITGLLSAIFPVYGLLFWCFGFGILHIGYGLLMFRKYQ